MDLEDKYENEILDRYLRLLVHKYERLEKELFSKNSLGHISPAGIRAINRIGRSGSERMTNLANHLRLTVGTLTTTIDHLVKRGYVNRHRTSEDRRVVEVVLSPKGQKAYDQIEINKKLMAEKIYGQLSDEERTTLKDILSKISQ